MERRHGKRQKAKSGSLVNTWMAKLGLCRCELRAAYVANGAAANCNNCIAPRSRVASERYKIATACVCHKITHIAVTKFHSPLVRKHHKTRHSGYARMLLLLQRRALSANGLTHFSDACN